MTADCATYRQFPQATLPSEPTTPSSRQILAQKHISNLELGDLDVDMSEAQYVTSFPPLVHVFTHLRLTMHAVHYRLATDKASDIDLICKGPPARRWIDTESMDGETLSTGMRKCWDLIRKIL